MGLQDTITRERQKNLARVTEELDAIVAEFGHDYVYPHARREETGYGKCMYVENKDPEIFDVIEGVDVEDLKPSCIIAQLAVRLGVELEALRELNEEGYSTLCTYIFIPYTNQFRPELAELQRRQDEGMSWGEAVDKFKQETREKVAA